MIYRTVERVGPSGPEAAGSGQPGPPAPHQTGTTEE